MNARVSIRIPAAELEWIDRAAAIDQLSGMEFMRAAALNAAQRRKDCSAGSCCTSTRRRAITLPQR